MHKEASKVFLIISLAIMAGLSYYVGHPAPDLAHSLSYLYLFPILVVYLFAGMVCHHSAFNLYAAYNVNGNVWLELLLPHLIAAGVSIYAFTF